MTSENILPVELGVTSVALLSRIKSSILIEICVQNGDTIGIINFSNLRKFYPAVECDVFFSSSDFHTMSCNDVEAYPPSQIVFGIFHISEIIKVMNIRAITIDSSNVVTYVRTIIVSSIVAVERKFFREYLIAQLTFLHTA